MSQRSKVDKRERPCRAVIVAADKRKGERENRHLYDTKNMRQVYAHDALVKMNPRDDPDAIGAAVTVALCGDWRHEPPCPLAPHPYRAKRG